MPLTPKLKMIGLGPKIGGSADSPHASAICLIQNIDPSYTVATISELVIAFVDQYVVFTVPNSLGIDAYEYTKLYLKSVDPEFISDDMAVAAVEWGLIKASPLNKADGKKHSDTPTGDTLGPEYSFDTSGGQKHVVQSVFTRDRQKLTAPGGGTAGPFSAPNVQQAIGVTKDRVEGCDIVTGDLKWSVKIKGINVTADYIDTLVDLTGTINSLTYYGRDVQELLFLGATGNYKPGDAWEVNYNFHQKKNQTDVSPIPGINFTDVYGHDFVWVGGYQTVTIGGFSVQVPTMAYCEQVYETRDFSLLGI